MSSSSDVDAIAQRSQRRWPVGSLQREKAVAGEMVHEQLANRAVVLSQKHASDAHAFVSTRPTPCPGRGAKNADTFRNFSGYKTSR